MRRILIKVTRRTVGIVDYGVGNHASVRQTLHAIGHRCRISSDPAVLAASDVIFLPGVGAFGAAMEALRNTGLAEFLQERGRAGQPFVGLCLGMQLLADAGHEYGYNAGLGLIPGEVIRLDQTPCHIGWNAVDAVTADSMFAPTDGRAMYFNHSFVFDTPPDYRALTARIDRPFTVGVRRENLVGLQFHPEKSQEDGRELLRNVIKGLCG
ncbi:Imidazole glycerol phosphate synthase subunit HisH 1 [Tsuneonella dongtanensis]|uniref:Imidazole glycerol phosphate synthase subunit HisH 1 n=1 Tax=Tsuneonella dongtanensis TaxID=692370 RepID=A0A1B2AA63_9SPHN|nr:imidazole glycerol phosphate synthase subunit HisH [Tsuneonella dongtanensis]ANY18945.1 Imidazole glycerol phosphate synthase subunit HisH 1 [Tsuneonella dongtanensis]